MGQLVGAASAMSMIRLTVNESVIGKSTEKSVLGMPRLHMGFSTMNAFYTEIFMSTMLVYIVLKYGDPKRKNRGFYWVETYACFRSMIMFLGRIYSDLTFSSFGLSFHQWDVFESFFGFCWFYHDNLHL